MIFPSKYIESAVSEFSRLPGIGKKTALRLVLHLLKQEKEDVKRFSSAMSDMRNEIKTCTSCCNYSDTDICNICSNNSRKKNIVCVVESAREVLAIENTGQYNGSYHVLGGVISPIDGIGPEKLNIDVLLKRVEIGSVDELVMALNPTIEGDTTVFYISKKLSNSKIKISTISRGIAFGSELEYTDEVTLARSIVSRIPYTLEKQN